MLQELESVYREYLRRFPLYHECVADPGARAAIDALPLLTEEKLDAIYYSQDWSGLSDAHKYMTSGTASGRRKAIYYSPGDERRYFENRKRIFGAFIGEGFRRAASDLGTGHACQTAEKIFASLGLESRSVEHTLPIDRHIEILNAFQPEVLFTMPMILDRLINHPACRFRPRKVIVVGDVATAAWKEGVAAFFGIGPHEILDILGSIEIGSIAFECAACRKYHFEDDLYPEAVPANRIDAGLPAQSEILVLTSKSRQYFPALRYVTYDLIGGFGETFCGERKRFSFDRILGRIGKDLKHGEKISYYDIATAVATVMGPVPFRVVQQAGHIRIAIESDRLDRRSIASIREKIGERNPDIKEMIASGLVGQIEIEESSKGGLSTVFKREARAGL